MKKMGMVLAGMCLGLLPAALFCQVQPKAGLIEIGAHLDEVYRYSAESNNDPGPDDVYWTGYDTLNTEVLILTLSGKLTDQLDWEFNNAFAWPAWNRGVPGSDFALTVLDANMEWKIMDQIGLVFGRQLVPTLLSNVPHQLSVIHTANPPLVLIGGYNGNMTPLPSYQTALGLDINFADFYLNALLYNGELFGANALPGGNDTGSQPDTDKMKGWNLNIGYDGKVGPGNLKARGFYFQESSDTTQSEPGDDSSISGYGIGAIYDAKVVFVGAEFASHTQDPDDPGYNSVTQYGYYGLLGGRISSLELALRYDFVDYTNQTNSDRQGAEDTDTETWYTFAVNYHINEWAALGLDYVIKYPEVPPNTDYPNINELSLIAELDLL